jgi:hypothetical protein
MGLLLSFLRAAPVTGSILVFTVEAPGAFVHWENPDFESEFS